MWVSRGGLPIGLPIGGYHHGTTEKTRIVIGLDVGKSSHWTCVMPRDSEVLASKSVANTRRSKALPRLSASPSPNPKSALSPKPKEGRTGISRYTPQFNLAASLPQVQIDPLVEGYGVAVVTGLPVAGHTRLRQQPLALVAVVGCNLVGSAGRGPTTLIPFVKTKKQDYLQKCSGWIAELSVSWSLNLQTFATYSDRHRR